MITFLSESDIKAVVNQSDMTNAMEECYASLANGSAFNFPVVRQGLNYQDAVFGFKSGFDTSKPALGIKAGGLWPGNRSLGLPNHQSTIMLFNPDSGAPSALVCATYLNALRTAAASALSVRHLARPDARVLGITAAGGQSEFQVRACLAEGNFNRVVVPERESGSGERLGKALADLNIEVEVLPIEALCQASDVLITVGLSFQPYIRADWVRSGTHVACMGTDTLGKQEVDAELLSACKVFGDAPDQNALLGECQHAVKAGILKEEQIVPLGEVITKKSSGRDTEEQITLFDSTGMGLQDVAAAQLAVELATKAGRFQQLDQWGNDE
ncbi:MAG: ornithine cyclodeaminase family protein [Pseudomonadota bacterium]